MNGLVEFLRARLEEDERAARTAFDFEYEIPQDAPWRVAQRHVENGAFTTWDGHIARHDPARVLADVEAKRRIMARHQRRGHPERIGSADMCVGCGTYGEFDDPVTRHIDQCPELRDLASIYADHRDYREEWRP